MSADLSELSIAVVHEHYYERGGAEHVAEIIARTFDAPIYTGFINQEALPPVANRENIEFNDLFGNRILSPLVRRFPWFRDFYYQLAWQRLPELTDFDVIIQSGNNPGWYVPPEEQTVIKYVHTTPRTAYDQFHKRADNIITKLYAYASRVLYHPNIPYPDIYIANSELVARRLTRYWGIENPEVIYPPTEVDTYTSLKKEDFYLTFSRLTDDKRFDEIIEAFRQHPNKRLVIGGSGPKENELKSQAADMPNVEFRGYLSEEEKRNLLGSAKALVYAAVNEDFGMVPIEAYASGTPVIGVRDGYTKYQIRDGVTGILYDRGVDTLANAVTEFEKNGVEASVENLLEVSRSYSLKQFQQSIRNAVETAVERSSINTGPEL